MNICLKNIKIGLGHRGDIKHFMIHIVDVHLGYLLIHFYREHHEMPEACN